MEEKKDIEQFTKGFCVPRDLVVDGQLIQQIFKDDKKYAAKGALVERRNANDILGELVAKLRAEKSEREEKNKLEEGYVESSQAEIKTKIAGEEIDIFTGLGAFSMVAFAKAVTLRNNEKAAFEALGFDVTHIENPEYRSKICGKIKDYLFQKNEESGHLSVELVHEEFLSLQAFLDCEPDHVTVYHWDIEVEKYGFKVHPRNDKAFPDDQDNLFPTLQDMDGKAKVRFPPHSLDPNDARSIWCRGLDHKLYAEGNAIKITNVYRKVDSGPLERLSEAHAEDGRFYKVTKDSCLDIMFKGPPPETQLPPQVEYCLGRCEDPPVINSGGR